MKTATSVSGLCEIEGAWRDLERKGVRSRCLGFDAARAMAAAAVGLATPLAVLVESGRERALVALAQSEGRIGALGSSVVDLVDPLATSDRAIEALVEAVGEATGDADLEISPIRGDSPHLSFWRKIAARSRRRDPELGPVVRRIGFAHAMLLHPGGAPSCTADPASRALVRTLETRFPVRHRTVDPADHAEAIAWMIAGPTKTTRRAAREARLLDDRTGAYLEALVESAPRDAIAIRAIEARDQVIAMILGLETRRTFTAHAYALSGELARYSPLFVCLYRAAGWLAERGVAELNLGRLAAPPAWADVRRPLLAVGPDRGTMTSRQRKASRRLDAAA